MFRLMDTFVRGYFYCKKSIRMLGTLPSVIFRDNTANSKDFFVRRTPDNKLYISKTNDNTPISNYIYFDWDLVKSVFPENAEFSKLLSLVSTTPAFYINTTESTRTGKNFGIRSLTHSGNTANSGLLLQKFNGSSFVSSLFLIDWDTGKVTHYTENDFILTVHTPQATVPTAIKGGIYFDNAESKFKKCVDGTNWIDM